MKRLLPFGAMLLSLNALAFPTVDLSGDVLRQTAVAAGTSIEYNEHPTTVILNDGKTRKELPSLGDDFRCALSFQAVIRLSDGSYLG